MPKSFLRMQIMDILKRIDSTLQDYNVYKCREAADAMFAVMDLKPEGRYCLDGCLCEELNEDEDFVSDWVYECLDCEVN